MNPRVSRSLGAGLEGDRLPDRQDRRQAGAWATPSTRSPTTSRRRRRASFEPTLDYVVVKIPRWAFEKFPAHEPDPGHADEVGGRGDGDRPHLQGGPAEGDPLARDRARGPAARTAQDRSTRRACARSCSRPELGAALLHPRTRCRPGWSVGRDRGGDRASIPGSCPSIEEIVEIGGRLRSFAPGDASRGAPAQRASGTASPIASSRTSPAPRRTRSARRAGKAGIVAGLQAGRHLRGAEFEAHDALPLLDLRGRRTRRSRRARRKVMILGGGPNRIGQGIEFDYCCCHASFALREEGFESDHGELQPGDGLDRLRHLGPALLRAAHARGRAEHRGASRSPKG